MPLMINGRRRSRGIQYIVKLTVGLVVKTNCIKIITIVTQICVQIDQQQRMNKACKYLKGSNLHPSVYFLYLTNKQTEKTVRYLNNYANNVSLKETWTLWGLD